MLDLVEHSLINNVPKISNYKGFPNYLTILF